MALGSGVDALMYFARKLEPYREGPSPVPAID